MLVRLLVLARVRIVLALAAVSSLILPIPETGMGFSFFMKKYTPLIIALILIWISTKILCTVFHYPLMSMMGMNILMGSWFMIFWFTKLINVSGFVKSFRQYDIITMNFPLYWYAYPVIEFSLGVAYIADAMMMYWLPINLITLCISWVTTIGILRSFSHPTKLHCACLGAHTDLTLGWVTLVECGSMIIMSLGMILLMMNII